MLFFFKFMVDWEFCVSQTTYMEPLKNDFVSAINKAIITNRAKSDINDPLLVPSRRSTGTFRYMSRPAAHRCAAILMYRSVFQSKIHFLALEGRVFGLFISGAIPFSSLLQTYVDTYIHTYNVLVSN